MTRYIIMIKFCSKLYLKFMHQLCRRQCDPSLHHSIQWHAQSWEILIFPRDLPVGSGLLQGPCEIHPKKLIQIHLYIIILYYIIQYVYVYVSKNNQLYIYRYIIICITVYIYIYVCIQTGIPMVTQGLHLFYTLQKNKTHSKMRRKCEENDTKHAGERWRKDLLRVPLLFFWGMAFGGFFDLWCLSCLDFCVQVGGQSLSWVSYSGVTTCDPSTK